MLTCAQDAEPLHSSVAISKRALAKKAFKEHGASGIGKVKMRLSENIARLVIVISLQYGSIQNLSLNLKSILGR